jgi:hypothetical protein
MLVTNQARPFTLNKAIQIKSTKNKNFSNLEVTQMPLKEVKAEPKPVELALCLGIDADPRVLYSKGEAGKRCCEKSKGKKWSVFHQVDKGTVYKCINNKVSRRATGLYKGERIVHKKPGQ